MKDVGVMSAGVLLATGGAVAAAIDIDVPPPRPMDKPIPTPTPISAIKAERTHIHIDTLGDAIAAEVKRIGPELLLNDMHTHREERLSRPSQPVGYRRVRVYKAGGGAKECARRMARQLADAQD